MQNIIDDYKDYREVDKELFKEFLNDIFMAQKMIKENKWKKFINQEDVDNSVKKVINKSSEYFKKEWLTDDDLAEIDDNLMYKEVFWLDNRDEQTLIWLSIYKWSSETTKNDNLFIRRISILDKLVDNGLVKISPFNVVKEFNNSDNNDINFVREMMSEQKNKIKEKYWEAIATRQLEWLKWKDKYFQYLVYKEDELKDLYKKLKQSDIKDFEFINWALKYWGRVAYMPWKWSARSDFLTYFFQKDIKEGISIEELYIYIEWVHGEIELNDKQSDKIYNLKRSLNTIIVQKTGINDFFYFWNTEEKGVIYRRY